MRAFARLSLMLSLVAIAAGGSVDGQTIGNGFFRLRATDGRITSLEIDPEGERRYGPNWVKTMGFEDVVATSETRCETAEATMHVRSLLVRQGQSLGIRGHGLPVLLRPGHTVGQAFAFDSARLDRVEVHTPTWATKDSSATLVVRRDGPDGPLVAQRRLENVVDNSWQLIAFEPQPPGRFYVELAEPQGMIGWWCTRRQPRKGVRAYADGKPVEDQERGLRAHGAAEVGKADVRLEADGNRLTVQYRLTPAPGRTPRPFPLLMTLRWDNTGYDVSAKSVPFFRFFADTMRYMPTQQLKRWRERDGHYERRFTGCKWIEADGTGNHDLRFHGQALGLAWHVRPEEATLRLSSASGRDGDVLTSRIVLEALPRADRIPAHWPRFVLPDAAQSDEASMFFYERAFTFPPVWGPGAWLEWNPITIAWQAEPLRRALGRHLATYPMTTEGYVHTWGAAVGWPFPDPKKYDTRHFDTNARFILGCRCYAAWTGDMAFLRGQAERLRKAMDYQLDVLGGRDGLIVAASKDVTGRHKGVGNNYWDILPFGHLDAYANVVWYASLEAMAQIEEMLARNEADARRSPTFYRQLAQCARRKYNDAFWDDTKGRYIGCIDIDGKKHDYGFTFVNVEAMAHGLADKGQVERIYRWMETEPTSSGKADTYTRWIFAPRATTVHNPRWRPEKGKQDNVPQEPWWHFGWGGTPFGDQCQDGGAILYTSFFDLMARCRYLGPDNAWKRWQEILGRWRMPDHLCGGPPLYRGEHPQQIQPGAVGTDIPFPESGMVPCWLLYGLLGVEATSRGLEIAPRLPSSVPWLEVRNVTYHGRPLVIRSDGREVLVRCEATGNAFQWRRKLGATGRVTFTLASATQPG